MIRRFSHAGIVGSFLLMAVCVLWALSAPVPRDRLFAAVPPNAVFVSIHEDLCHRLPTLLEHPIIRTIWQIALEDHTAQGESENIAESLTLLRRITGKLTIISVLPPEADGQHPVLVVSAASGWSQRLRWLASLGRLPVTIAERYYGTPIWQLHDNPLPRPLYFCALEGMVIASLAKSPRPLERAIDRCYRVYPRLRDLTARRSCCASLINGDRVPAADHGWLYIPDSPPHIVSWSVTRLSTECTSIRFYFPAIEPTDSDALISASPESALAASHACVAVVNFTPNMLNRLSRFFPGASVPVARCIAKLAGELGSGHLSLILLEPSGEGSCLDLLPPVLPVIGYRLSPDADPETALARVTDWINGHTSWNLVLRPLPDPGGARRFAVESGIEGSTFDEIPSGLRPQVLVSRHHLFLAPASVDMRCLEGLEPSLISRLSTSSDATNTNLASAVVDLRRLAPLVQRAASLYVLKTLVAPQPDKDRQDPQKLLRVVQLSTRIMKQTGRIRAFTYAATGKTIMELETESCSDD